MVNINFLIQILLELQKGNNIQFVWNNNKSN
uniref:Uncharacterized protein n=1 Tax=Ciona intestinalis TaxID=7719 RepID=F6YNZ2_CIOIN